MLRFIENIIQCVNDVKAYRQFRKDVKYELSRADSKMTKYNIKENWLGNVLYVQINCTDLDLRTAEFDTDRMLLMKMKPIVEYLGDELGWSEYLVPQISNFEWIITDFLFIHRFIIYPLISTDKEFSVDYHRFFI